jgi:hypothetical protein
VSAEHLAHEISGPDGLPIPMSIASNSFDVHVHLAGEEPTEWTTIDHRAPAQQPAESLPVEPPERQFVDGHPVSIPISQPPEKGNGQKPSRYDPFSARLHERGIK